MEIHFSKYQGAGNDFLVINNTGNEYNLTEKIRKKLCDRRFGVGADGVLEFKASQKADFGILYYNADGKAGSLCGNACRCAIAYAVKTGIAGSSSNSDNETNTVVNDTGKGNPNIITNGKSQRNYEAIGEGVLETENGAMVKSVANLGSTSDEKLPCFTFEAYDGLHVGGVSGSHLKACGRQCYEYYVHFTDIALDGVKVYDGSQMFLDNGSPHHVSFVNQDVDEVDVLKLGKEMRHGLYGKEGSNINFVSSKTLCNQGDGEVENKASNKVQTQDALGMVNGEKAASDLIKENAGVEGQRPEDPGRVYSAVLRARTYERGVEDETYACGTGAVAIAVADYVRTKGSSLEVSQCLRDVNSTGSVMNGQREKTVSNFAGDMKNAEADTIRHIKRIIQMPGGSLKVDFKVNEFKSSPVAYDVSLSGPAEHVFDGVYIV